VAAPQRSVLSAVLWQQPRVSRNILASDLGVIAKQGSDGKLTVLVSDLLSTRPMQ
jgi:hypothetical protein